ncbi:MAG: hypothetical protein E6860_13335 [Clostridium sp.]|uniref:hypothetical protein n=1 Tax=Clostridium sp. TaxID=1506 RepID=UPI0028FF0799|nr:hypothetical protein [Clostridium sp.]MDU1586515.1 hypothetical protein [Clostridium sp.]
MNIFNINEEKMNQTSSTNTLNEIYQQPKTWKKTLSQIAESKDSIKAFIDEVIKCDDLSLFK